MRDLDIAAYIRSRRLIWVGHDKEVVSSEDPRRTNNEAEDCRRCHY